MGTRKTNFKEKKSWIIEVAVFIYEFEVMMKRSNLLALLCKIEQFQITLLKILARTNKFSLIFSSFTYTTTIFPVGLTFESFLRVIR